MVPLTEEIWPLEKGGKLCKIIKANCMIIQVTIDSISKGKDDGFRVSKSFKEPGPVTQSQPLPISFSVDSSRDIAVRIRWEFA